MQNKMEFKLVKNRRFKFTSKYNVKLYKKCLSLKLILKNKNKYRQPNIILNRSKGDYVKHLKCIYIRKERIPFRLLSLCFSLNNNLNLAELRSNFLVAQNLSVYNGKELKFINVLQSSERVMKCLYTFGDLIFTRARYKFKKKKKKKRNKWDI